MRFFFLFIYDSPMDQSIFGWRSIVEKEQNCKTECPQDSHYGQEEEIWTSICQKFEILIFILFYYYFFSFLKPVCGRYIGGGQSPTLKTLNILIKISLSNSITDRSYQRNFITRSEQISFWMSSTGLSLLKIIASSNLWSGPFLFCRLWPLSIVYPRDKWIKKQLAFR